MSKFLTTKAIGATLEQIIRNAKREVYLISPYMKPDHMYLTELHRAADKGVKIRVIYGKTELIDDVREALREIKNIEGRFLEHLHAKMYFNENELLITSMNFYDFSERNNREVGVYFKRVQNGLLFRQAFEEAQFMWKLANENEYEADEVDSEGFCIRCSANMTFNPIYPYCNSCFKADNKTISDARLEVVCHGCGNQHNSSYANPLCNACLAKPK